MGGYLHLVRLQLRLVLVPVLCVLISPQGPGRRKREMSVRDLSLMFLFRGEEWRPSKTMLRTMPASSSLHRRRQASRMSERGYHSKP